MMIVKNTGNYIRHFGDVVLVPGTSELNKEQSKSFNEAIKHPLNKALIDKEITIVQGNSQSESDGLSEINATDALALIVDTYDVELLNKWLGEETEGKNRKTVVTAIENQIEDIKNPDPGSVVDPNE